MARSLSVLLVIALMGAWSAAAFVPRQSTWGVSRSATSGALSEQSDAAASKRTLSSSQADLRRVAQWHKNGKVTTCVLRMAAAESTPSAPVKIIIAGAPASGKGTQCEMIKDKYNVVHLSTGDMLRAAVQAQTEVGKLAKEYMEAGKLVPDDVIIGVVSERLGQEDCQTQGWLLDGFPRTQAQAQALADSGVSADCFVFLNVPDDILVERVVGRRTDPETGKIYHLTFSPPEDEAVKARLEQRADDTEDKVKVRLDQFHANVDAVKDSYTDISVVIDGNQAKDDVTRAVFDAIESRIGVSA